MTEVMNNATVDLVAKLLANEDIHVVRKAVKTAQFNIESRELVLPVWKTQTPEIDQLFVAHEVGHALYTTSAYTDALISKTDTRLQFPKAKSFLNVLEDVRIDKLMKRRYPGLRKVYGQGYKELSAMDFFGLKNRDMESMHLLDRINVLFKVGATSGVTFSAEEKQFVERCERLESIEETINLAHDLFKFLKEEQEKKQQTREEEQEEEVLVEDDDADEDGDGEDQDDADSESSDEDDSDLDPSDEDETGGEGVDTPDDIDHDDDVGGPVTNDNFENRVNELADTSVEHRYFTIENTDFDRIIGYKQITQAVNEHIAEHPYKVRDMSRYQSFRQETENNISYMIKEFELRKAATAYKRTQIAKTGALDMKKLWSYKLNEDLFKRVTTVKAGKNHGMIFLLDWSGSMDDMIDETIDQLINLTTFCHRAGIAYQVLAFSDRFHQLSHIPSMNGFAQSKYQNEPEPTYYRIGVQRLIARKTLQPGPLDFCLLELFSSRMSIGEYHTMANNLRAGLIREIFSLGGTPLNESLMFMYDYVGLFQKTHKCEKTAFITLTDGEGDRMFGELFHRIAGSSRPRNFITETVTKKTFELPEYSAGQTSTLLEMIKARYNCTILGFYLSKNKYGNLRNAVQAHYSHIDTVSMANTTDRVRNEINERGYASLKGTGRDELFIVPSLKINRDTIDDLKINNGQTARSIASKFAKFMNKRKTSRLLLDRFIGHVA